MPSLPKSLASVLLSGALSLCLAGPLRAFDVLFSAEEPGTISLASEKTDPTPVLVDEGDYPLVRLAAGLFADDLERVTGRRPSLPGAPVSARQLVVAGTLGHSGLIAKLVDAGKLRGLEGIQGRWEATSWQVVEKPFPGVDRALVIVGSDRRGTAYGLMKLSEKIGVSPWYWWADVPVARRANLSVRLSSPESDAPAVQYRGIFINDEDWGLHPWAKDTFEPEYGGIGPKTYKRCYELMLRLRLNYLWPAMHECSREFDESPENYKLADQWGIVAGSSHCEPMLCNNVHWDEKARGPWNYSLNPEAIHRYWENTAKARGPYEAVWTLGIRGIHDRGMARPPESVPERIKLVGDVFKDQRALLDTHVSKAWGPIAQCFVPYKEVLPLYEAGLQVPDEVTLVWVDDNFGYLRRIGLPAERKRSGGAGVYWHLSYYGGPHSYLWINTTAPALMWEELHKAWENDARRLWVINVGDIKPMEIGMDYFSRFAWSPETFGPDSQPRFLQAFAAGQFGPEHARSVADLLTLFYRLGTIRKPELMNREWACSLPEERAAELRAGYAELLSRDARLSARLPAELRDAYFEMIGFPARVLGAAGQIFLADREDQLRGDTAGAAEIARLRSFLEREVLRFNNETAGGKWKHLMPGLETAPDLTKWNSQVRWPWGEKQPLQLPAHKTPPRTWRAKADRQLAAERARWVTVDGLGSTGSASVLKPAGLESSWSENDSGAPALEYDFSSPEGAGVVLVDFLPTFRICAGMRQRVLIALDGGPGQVVEVPGSSGQEDEYGRNRSFGVLNNFVRAEVPLGQLKEGRHTLKIRALDPGLAIDRVSLPER